MPNLSEALLARLTDPTRAAAIYGDLVELAITRGRLWFWLAYARTLFALTWRFMLALVVATVVRQIFVNSFHVYLRHANAAWRSTNGPFLLNSMGPLLAFITFPLWFVLPFAAVLYGTRDRFVQLTFAVTVGTTVAFFFIPFASLACSIATFAVAVAALFSSTWRKPAMALLLTGVAGLLAIAAVNAIDTTLLSHHPDWRTSYFFTHYGAMLIFRSSLLLLAFACARLHRQLLEPPQPAGAAHANLSEALLARLTDPTRAAAIYGDLTELAATRGRLWFWTTYVRTLIALGWRTPAAIVAAIVFTTYFRGAIAFRLQPHWLDQFHQRALDYQRHPHLNHFCWILSLNVMFCAWIIFPYVAIRFGLRNRLTYVAGVLLLLATPVYSTYPRVYEVTGLLIALIIVAALASPLWRWQMIFFAANLPIFRLAFYVCIDDPLGIFHPHHHLYPISFFRMRIDDPVAILLTVMIGPALYRWLLQPRTRKVVHV